MIATVWLLFFIKGNSNLIDIGFLSMLTAQWQNYGHLFGYLPNNITNPFSARVMFTFMLIVFACLIISSCLLKDRFTILFAFIWHLWLELGFRTGWIELIKSNLAINQEGLKYRITRKLSQRLGC